MSEYRTTEHNVLIELLSKHTTDYTRLLSENGNRQQLYELKLQIVAIQKEVNYRKKLSGYKVASTDYIYLSYGDLF